MRKILAIAPLIVLASIAGVIGLLITSSSEDLNKPTQNSEIAPTPIPIAINPLETVEAQIQPPNLPPYVLNQAPFLSGKYVMYLSWQTGNNLDSQNFDKYLLENFGVYLDQSVIPKDIIPEITSNVLKITTKDNLMSKNFNPDKDKVKADIFYNKLRLTELGSDTRVFTPLWWSAKEIDLSFPVVQSLIEGCGSIDGIKAIEFVPAEDMSNLISIDDTAKQVMNAFDNGNSMVVQNNIVSPEIRNAAVLVSRKITASKSSGLRYMVFGDNELIVGCVLRRIADGGGAGGSRDFTGGLPGLSSISQQPPSELPSTSPSEPPTTPPIIPPSTSPSKPPTTPPDIPPAPTPIPPVPELSTITLMAAGLVGLFMLAKLKRRG